MTNEELKKKIAQIIADYFCPQGNEHKKLWGDDRLCYSKMNFAECERVAKCVDALIAAGIGDVSELKKHRVQIMKDGSIKQLYSGEEVEQIVKEREEYKHRAEVAERALFLSAKEIEYLNGDFDSSAEFFAKEKVIPYFMKKAEKELAEERKE